MDDDMEPRSQQPLADLARALADELRSQKERTEAAEARASMAKMAEVQARNALANERAGWKKRQQDWYRYKAKHQALRDKYRQLQSVIGKEKNKRALQPLALPAARNGPSTPPSQKVPEPIAVTRTDDTASSSAAVTAASSAAVTAATTRAARLGMPPPASRPPAAKEARPKRSSATPAAPAPNAGRKQPTHHEVVRGKDARAKMAAVTCSECRGFFDAAGGILSADALLRCHADCSRHRVHSREQHDAQQTPEGFWQIGFSDDESPRERQPTAGSVASSLFDLNLGGGGAGPGPKSQMYERERRLAGRQFGRKTR